MNSVTAVSIGLQSICQPPFNELSNGLVFEMRRPAVLDDCNPGLREIDDLNTLCLRHPYFLFLEILPAWHTLRDQT